MAMESIERREHIGEKAQAIPFPENPGKISTTRCSAQCVTALSFAGNQPPYVHVSFEVVCNNSNTVTAHADHRRRYTWYSNSVCLVGIFHFGTLARLPLIISTCT